MAFGLGVLKHPPTVFWGMTPRELDAALQGHFGRRRSAPAPSRAAFENLMSEFPDLQPTE